MAKDNVVIGHLIDIKTDVAAIKEHLKTLNGKVASHELRLQKTEDEITGFGKKFAYFAGGFTVFTSMLIFILDYGKKLFD